MIERCSCINIYICSWYWRLVSPFEDVLFFRPRPHSLDRRIPPLSLRTHGYLLRMEYLYTKPGLYIRRYPFRWMYNLTSLVHEAYSIIYLRLTEALVQVPNLNRFPQRRMPAERSATTPSKRIHLDSIPTYEIPTRSLATVLDQLLRLDACMGTTWTVGT